MHRDFDKNDKVTPTSMGSRTTEWVRIFDITEISQHKKGFTIYKVISMLYPEQCPDAITKITVWKRYNEFKKLHKDLRAKHKSLHLRDRFPGLPSHPYFKRFNKDVIMERKEAILNFLEYVGREPALFTSHFFVKFFESSHTPNSLLNGSINLIRADLHLPSEPEYSFLSLNSDDEQSISDTDSISTMSSLSPSTQTVDLLADPTSRSTSSLNRKLSTEFLMETSKVASIDSGSIVSTPTPPLSPHGIDPDHYISEAAEFISQATKHEVENRHDDAFVAYKQGIDILLKNVKNDKDARRRDLVRFKVERYLLRAEKIYNLYLSPEMKSIQELARPEEVVATKRPTSDLFKYKVIKVFNNSMLVMHTETQELYFVKVIYKMLKYSREYLILPENVPFMIKLQNYYDCENALFLILEYSSGQKLTEYIDMHTSVQQLSDAYYDQANESDGSEGSYSDLVNEYASSSRASDEVRSAAGAAEAKVAEDDDDVVELPEVAEIDRVILKSRELISSMDLSLNKQLESVGIGNEQEKRLPIVERKLSDISTCEDFDAPIRILNVDDVVKWSAQLLLALEKLHVLGVVCCDLSVDKLLIDKDMDLILMYMYSISKEKPFKTVTGNDVSYAPELYGYEPITRAVDWWSYGTILYELLVGVPLKYAHPEGFRFYTYLKVPRHVSAEGMSLLKQLLVYDPKQRLGYNSTDDIKMHPFFNSISWEQLSGNRKYI